MNFFPTNDFSLLEICELYIIAKYKVSSYCKIEAFIHRCSVKRELLNILQNSQESPNARVSFLKSCRPEACNFNIIKKRLRYRCFPVNIAKFLRTPSVAASVKIRPKSLKSAKFQFQLFLTTVNIMGSLYIVTK